MDDKSKHYTVDSKLTGAGDYIILIAGLIMPLYILNVVGVVLYFLLFYRLDLNTISTVAIVGTWNTLSLLAIYTVSKTVRKNLNNIITFSEAGIEIEGVQHDHLKKRLDTNGVRNTQLSSYPGQMF
jgi:hypothetical protein